MNKLPEYFCVKNDQSQLFKDTVIKYINDNFSECFVGDAEDCYYGCDPNGTHHFSNFNDFCGRPTLLTLTEFIDLTTETEFVLPKNWHIITTPENLKAVSEWRLESTCVTLGLDLAVGCSTNNSNSRDHNPKYALKSNTYDFGIEITFDQFKKYVLKEDDDIKKIIGYKLIKPEYEKAAIAITKYDENGVTSFQSWMMQSCDGAFAKRLKQADVLDSWFEPVYNTNYNFGNWVFITGKGNTGNGLATNGKDDGVFKLLAIDETKNPSGHYSQKSDFMFEYEKDVFFRTAKTNIVRKATEEEILNAKHKGILAEVKKKYTVGTKFSPAHVVVDSNYCIITNSNFKIIPKDKNNDEIDSIVALTDENKSWDAVKKYGNTSLGRIVYSDGKWATIEAKPIIRIRGYNAKFTDTEVSFGCQTYSKAFVIELNECLLANNFQMDCKADIKIMADWFNKR
jgi:hypothetical protein